MDRDGFVVRELGTGKEVSFIACDKTGSSRERTEMGLLRNMNWDAFYVEDTRDVTVES
jgi:hypothetical protein